MHKTLHTASLDWITPDAEKVIARHARVSSKDPDKEDYAGLVSFCIKHGHWSILEQASASFEVITTRAISPQILRHRSFTFQETSQRYCNPNEILSVEEKPFQFDLRYQGKTNRQVSESQLPLYLHQEFWDRLEIIDTHVQDLYNDMLKRGVARECARNILPLYTPTKLHISGTIRSFVHYVGLRGKEDTQHEHRAIVRCIGRSLKDKLPVVVEAVKKAREEDKGLAGWDFLK